MKITNNTPEFSMPELITLEQQIELLQQRILELEKELSIQRTTTVLTWDNSGRSLGESIGINTDAEMELGRILKHWIAKYDGAIEQVYRELVCCPLPFPEKLLMVAILSGSTPQKPQAPSPMSPEEFFRKVFGGQKQ